MKMNPKLTLNQITHTIVSNLLMKCINMNNSAKPSTRSENHQLRWKGLCEQLSQDAMVGIRTWRSMGWMTIKAYALHNTVTILSPSLPSSSLLTAGIVLSLAMVHGLARGLYNDYSTLKYNGLVRSLSAVMNIAGDPEFLIAAIMLPIHLNAMEFGNNASTHIVLSEMIYLSSTLFMQSYQTILHHLKDFNEPNKAISAKKSIIQKIKHIRVNYLTLIMSKIIAHDIEGTFDTLSDTNPVIASNAANILVPKIKRKLAITNLALRAASFYIVYLVIKQSLDGDNNPSMIALRTHDILHYLRNNLPDGFKQYWFSNQFSVPECLYDEHHFVDFINIFASKGVGLNFRSVPVVIAMTTVVPPLVLAGYKALRNTIWPLCKGVVEVYNEVKLNNSYQELEGSNNWF